MAEHKHSDRPKRKRQYSMIPFVALGIAVVLIVLIIIGITSCAKGCSEDSTQTEQEPTETTANTVKDSESSFKMSIAGDYIIYSSIYKGANENANGTRTHPDTGTTTDAAAHTAAAPHGVWPVCSCGGC